MTIPAFYRILFTWVDGLICLEGVYVNIFGWKRPFRAHITGLRHLKDDELRHVAPLMHPLGGLLLFQAVVSLFVLPRVEHDVGLWRIVQAGLAFSDAVIIYSMAVIEGNKQAAAKPRGRDRGLVVGMAAMTVKWISRVFFLGGIGL